MTSASTIRTLSERVRQPASAICFSASARYLRCGVTRWKLGCCGRCPHRDCLHSSLWYARYGLRYARFQGLYIWQSIRCRTGIILLSQGTILPGFFLTLNLRTVMLPRLIWPPRVSKILAKGLDLFALRKVRKRSPVSFHTRYKNGAEGAHLFGAVLLTFLLDEHTFTKC